MNKREVEAYIKGAYEAHGYPKVRAGDTLTLTKKGERHGLTCIREEEDKEIGGRELTFDNGLTLYEIEYFNNIDLWRRRGYKIELLKGDRA